MLYSRSEQSTNLSMLVDSAEAGFDAQFYQQLHYADGGVKPPPISGRLKADPAHFSVSERLGFRCSGHGEHVWLNITKIQLPTDRVAKYLARHAGVAVRDVGYSGLKDVQANTTQWFSVWLPGRDSAQWPDWRALESDQLVINEVTQHDKKLRRGTHVANHFSIVIDQISGDLANLQQSVERLQQQGAPNYFGPQRFGYNGSNLQQVNAMFRQGRTIKQRQKRSLLLSAARSWLFNTVLSERLRAGTWSCVQPGEPLNLQGSRQCFVSTDTQVDQQRLAAHDLHTTGPLWGRNGNRLLDPECQLHRFETEALAALQPWQTGLENAGLDYARRALRLLPQALQWAVDNNRIELQFELARGQYATALLRELVAET